MTDFCCRHCGQPFTDDDLEWADGLCERCWQVRDQESLTVDELHNDPRRGQGDRRSP